jgi:hypothetical protein
MQGQIHGVVVDSKEYLIIDMEKYVAKYFSWASYQEAIFWYVEQMVIWFDLQVTNSF